MKYLILLTWFISSLTWAAKYTDLIHSADVASGTDTTVTFTPAAGEEVILESFNGNAGENLNTTVIVVWDYNGAGETVKWSTHGSVNDAPSIVIGTGDGVKQVGLCLKNDDTTSRVLSGKANFKRVK
jgi:hypothetical protein